MTKTPLKYGYHPCFSPSFYPTVCAGSTLARTAQLLLRKPLTQTSWLSSGPYAWYGVSTIGNAYFRRPSVAALAIPTPATAAPSLEPALSTIAPDSNNAPQVCGPGDRGALPQRPRTHRCKRLPAVHSTHPAEERDQARNGRAGGD